MLIGRSSRMDKAVPLTLMAAAYHAAGHAVANIVQRLDLHPVSVPLDGLHNGVVVDHTRVAELRATHDLNVDTFTLHRQNLLERKVRSYLAGRFAQRRFSPRSWRSRHDSGDQQKAIGMLLRASRGSERTATAWMRLLSIPMEDLIERSWPGIEAVVSALTTHRALLATEATGLSSKRLRVAFRARLRLHASRAPNRENCARNLRWFTEGFDTGYLNDAKVLLDEFSS